MNMFSARIGAAAMSSAVLGTLAFAFCYLYGGPLALAVGVVSLVGAFALAAFAAVAARSATRRARDLAAQIEALGTDAGSLRQLTTIPVRNELDEVHNAVARRMQATSAPLESLSKAAEAIAAGDLSVDIKAEGSGTSADLVTRFGRMRDSLKQLVGEVQANSMDVTSSAEELSAAIEEISSSIEQVSATITQVSQGAQSQSEQVAQASHALRETAAQLERSAAEAREAAGRVRQADETSAEGAKSAAEASRRISEVTHRADETAVMVRGFAENIGRISEFVDVIVRISDQTNLLALNAAIEAARAGEHGRGFTVVADEVRKLAEESAKGAEEVQRVITGVTAETARIVTAIGSMTSEVKQGDDVVRQAIGRFEDITQQVSEISELVGKMADSIEQMSRRGSEVAKNIESVSASAEETAASAQEVSAAIEEQTASIAEVATTSQNLAGHAAQALQSTRRFRTNAGAAAAGPTPRREVAADMPPMFRPPPRPQHERKRVPLTREADGDAQERVRR